MAIIALFLLHAVMGGFEIAGVIDGGSAIMKSAARIMATLIGVHLIIGTKLTTDTVRAVKKSGKHYFRENKLFWVRRVSGFAVMLFIAVHIMIFTGKTENGVYRLHFFGAAELVTQILLVLTLLLHILTNAKPLMLGFGTRSWKEMGLDLALILAGILLFAGVCFVIYYLRWQL